MAEILTESFCERCGTRYTFESTAPKPRLGGRFRTISRGLKNFVLDDQASLDDALAAAKNDVDREATSQQLEAFHKTFNFCMSCRQYTCSNCWNEAEGQCQSCSPLLGGGITDWTRTEVGRPAPRTAEPTGIEATAWPSADLRRAKPAPPEPEAPPEPQVTAPMPVEAVEPVAPATAAEPFPAGLDVAATAAQPQPEPEAEADVSPLARLEAFKPTPRAKPAAGPVPTREAPPPDVHERVAAARAATSGLLGRFRPGQSLDEALAAYEATHPTDEAPAGPAPAPEVELEPEPEPVAFVEPEPEPVAFVEPEPEPETEPEPERKPVAWPSADVRRPAPARPTPSRPSRDVVEPPRWPVPTVHPTPAERSPSDSLPAAASAERVERPTPQWPGHTTESFLAARLAANKSGDAMWAASSADVLRNGPGGAAESQAGVQACVSCGLSLSATARFCRRCGTRQA